MAVNLASMSIVIGVDSSGVTDGLGKASRTVKTGSEKMTTSIKKTRTSSKRDFNAMAAHAKLKSAAMAGAMAGAVTGVVSGAITKGISMVKRAITSMVNDIKVAMVDIDKLAKTSDKLGVSTKELSGLRFAAELTGVKVSELDIALQRMTRRLSEAAKGGGSAAKAIKELGLDARKLADAGPRVALLAIADAMQKVESQSDKVRLSFALFDSGGVALVNTLKDGSAGIIKIEKEAARLGLTMSRDVAQGIEQANDAVKKMKLSMKGASNSMTVFLAPTIRDLSASMTDFIIGTNDMGEAGKNSFEKMAVAGEAFAESIRNSMANVLDYMRPVVSFLTLGASNALGANEMAIDLAEQLRKDRPPLSLPGPRIPTDDFAPAQNPMAQAAQMAQAAPRFRFASALQHGSAGALSAFRGTQERRVEQQMERQIWVLEQINDNIARMAVQVSL